MNQNQTQLFAEIDRAAMMEQLEKNTRIMNYTGRVNLYSNANNPYQRYSQLDCQHHLGCFGKENSQPSRLPEPFIYESYPIESYIYTHKKDMYRVQ